jgi:hypothetical protein
LLYVLFTVQWQHFVSRMISYMKAYKMAKIPKSDQSQNTSRKYKSE